MPDIILGEKTYHVDPVGFLMDFNQWDRAFAENLALRLSIPGGLTEKHWQVINFIRDWYEKKGLCPLVYIVCEMNKLRINELMELFPTGYLRGACKLAGITYKYAYDGNAGKLSILAGKESEAFSASRRDPEIRHFEKSYLVDVCGFLINPGSWDEQFAVHKAFELKLPDLLTDSHWKVIHFLRRYYYQNGNVPTVYDTCSYFGMEIDELGKLFPDGYHRGAVKIAGLRV
ncbi:MAG: TusE/DsrC/DsvC family sulfur relay protein [Thermodesulfobacteriota bacterium]